MFSSSPRFIQLHFWAPNRSSQVIFILEWAVFYLMKKKKCSGNSSVTRSKDCENQIRRFVLKWNSVMLCFLCAANRCSFSTFSSQKLHSIFFNSTPDFFPLSRRLPDGHMEGKKMYHIHDIMARVISWCTSSFGCGAFYFFILEAGTPSLCSKSLHSWGYYKDQLYARLENSKGVADWRRETCFVFLFFF